MLLPYSTEMNAVIKIIHFFYLHFTQHPNFRTRVSFVYFEQIESAQLKEQREEENCGQRDRKLCV